jgi:hypothetical protein
MHSYISHSFSFRKMQAVFLQDFIQKLLLAESLNTNNMHLSGGSSFRNIRPYESSVFERATSHVKTGFFSVTKVIRARVFVSCVSFTALSIQPEAIVKARSVNKIIFYITNPVSLLGRAFIKIKFLIFEGRTRATSFMVTPSTNLIFSICS